MKKQEHQHAANLMLDYAPVAAYWTRKDGSFAWVNQCACDMLGYTREELLDLTIHAIDKEVDRDFWSRYWDEIDDKEISLLERWHTRRDGSVIPVEVTVRLLEHRGEAVHLAFVRDLTEQKQADELQKGHAQYMTALFKDSPMPQIIIDPGKMQIIDANTAAEIFYGYEQLRGRCISTINTLTPEEISREMKAARSRKRNFFRFRHRLASGSIRDVHVYSGPINHEGRVLLHSNIEDMTPLYAFQKELEAYRDQLERLPIGVYRATPGLSGVFISVNQAMCEILEVDAKADLIGRRASDFHPTPAAREELSSLIVKSGGVRRIERKLVSARGRQIYALLSVSITEEADGERFFEGSIQDITARKRAEIQRESAFRRLHNALDAAPIPIMLHRVDGAIEQVNAVWCNLTGYDKDELKTVAEWTRLAYGDRSGEVRAHIETLQHEYDTVDEGDYTIRCKDGSTRIWAFYSSALESPGQPDGMIMSTAVDVTAQRAQQQQERQAEAILQSAAEGITVTGPDRNIQRVNPSFTRITGYAMADVVGKNPRVLSSGRQDSAFYESMWQQIDQYGNWQGEIWNRRKNGEVYPEWLSISAIHDAKGNLINYAAVFTDLTELRQFQSSLQSLRRYDPLTGLANKATLLEWATQAIKVATRNRKGLALLAFGLDRFHLINETFGHKAGDNLLRQLAEQMKCVAGEDADIARIGGDHFALLVPDTSDDRALSDFLLRLRGISTHPFQVDQKTAITLSFSTGVAQYPVDAQTAVELLRGAETAMFQAKRHNPGLHTFLDGTTTASTQQRLLLEIDLRQAIENDQIEVYFQPVVSVADGRIIGAEGLARWQHPELGPVSPETFISIAEESGLIGALTETLLSKAAKRMADLCQRYSRPLRLAFNISAIQLNQSDFVEKILHELRAAGLAPTSFELELTESTLMQRVSDATDILAALREHGVSISIDDFGTGYSSLAYLQEIKAQTLKIDKRFIASCPTDKASGQLVRSIIAMGHALGMQLIAEGVETQAHLDFLRKLHCEFYQGYLFSKPLPFADFETLLSKEQHE